MASKFCLIATLLSAIMIVAIQQCEAGGYGHGGGGGGGHDGGHSSSHYKHDGHAYKFGYDIVDPHGAKNSRHESDDGYGNRHGSYSIYDKDGRKRIVEYVADKKGFRAKIHSNEPGLQSHHAAHAHYDVEPHHGGYHGGYDEGHGYKHDGGHGDEHHY